VPAPASPGPPPPAEPPAATSPASSAGRAGVVGRASSGGRIARIARVALVVGTTAGGTGAHVRMLAVGLAGHGIDVSVLGPSSADAAFGFGAAGVTFSPVEFGDRPRPGDVAAVLRLRRLLGHGSAAAESDVVHAHGLRAGALTVLALAGPRHRARPRLVVTVHNGPPAGGGARSVVYRLLERVVARGADLVLCVSPDLEALMRSAGAGRVDRAIVPPADPGPLRASGQAPTVPDRTAVSPTTPTTPVTSTTPVTFAPAAASETETTPASARPVVLAVGRLAAQKDFGTLLVAAAQWRDLDPPPLLAIAGDGPLAGELRAQAASLCVDAAFLGRRDDVAELLAAATVFVLPSRWEGQPLILQEALRAGAAIVATRVGGIPDLVGDDAAVLVPPGDPQALAAAVRALLADPPLAARLRAAAAVRCTALPTAADAVAAALAAYAQALAPT
jgi:glycosyltransferase involved in cell wall biosynthesis